MVNTSDDLVEQEEMPYGDAAAQILGDTLSSAEGSKSCDGNSDKELKTSRVDRLSDLRESLADKISRAAKSHIRLNS